MALRLALRFPTWQAWRTLGTLATEDQGAPCLRIRRAVPVRDVADPAERHSRGVESAAQEGEQPSNPKDLASADAMDLHAPLAR